MMIIISPSSGRNTAAPNGVPSDTRTAPTDRHGMPPGIAVGAPPVGVV